MPRVARILIAGLILVVAIPVVWVGIIGTTASSTVVFGFGILGLGAFAGMLLRLVLYGRNRYEFYENSFKVNSGSDIPYTDISKIDSDGTNVAMWLGNRKRLVIPANPSMGPASNLYTWLEEKSLVQTKRH